MTRSNFHNSCHFLSPGHELIAVDEELGHCLQPLVLSFIPTGSEDVELANVSIMSV